jgi:hypothetical protein
MGVPGRRTTSRHFGHLILRPRISAGTVNEAEQLGQATATFDITQIPETRFRGPHGPSAHASKL